MAGFIPENILEDILNRIDIVELISGYIPLKRAGRNFKANCPFHHEKTPSFMVSSERQIYHCFGCGESGNAFKFLMRYERFEFPEAVEMLAKRTGVILPDNQKSNLAGESIAMQLYKINESALLFYEQNLNSLSCSVAKKYLLERGVNQKTIESFRLGFAFDKWDALINHLRPKGAALSLLEKAGLVIAKEGGGYYDRFRNRIIFPIFNIKSEPIGFGARLILKSGGNANGDNSLPKYVNSPETPIYTKGRNLYGLNFAKEAIRQDDFAAVVEGYLDFIIPFQEGFQNIVASLGTALTEEQVRLLKRYTRNVVMIYDPDTAGEIAALRSLDIFIDEGMNVKIVSLPKGYDPDLFVRKYGIASFKEKIHNARNLFDYKLQILKSRYNTSEIEGKADIASEMLATISKFNNAVLKSEYIKKLAEELAVKEEALAHELNKIKAPSLNQKPQEQSPLAKKNINISPTEKLLIKLLLEEAEFIGYAKKCFDPNDLNSEIACRIISTMFELFNQGKKIDIPILMQLYGEGDITQALGESAFLPETSGEDKQKLVNDCIRRLKDERVKSKRRALHEQIRMAQQAGDEETINRLMQEFHFLIKRG